MSDRFTFEPGVSIRPAGPGDLEALFELDTAVFGEVAYPYFVLRQLFDLHRLCWLIAEGPPDHLRGYTLAVRCSDREGEPDEPTAWLIGLGVRETYRRKGCGRMLTEAALDMLTKDGVRIAKLTVEPDNDKAIALYRECGFVKTDDDGRDYFGKGHHRDIMAVRLPRGSAMHPPG